jgi:hypothetical protein
VHSVSREGTVSCPTHDGPLSRRLIVALLVAGFSAAGMNSALLAASTCDASAPAACSGISFLEDGPSKARGGRLTNDYHLVNHWLLDGTVEEVTAIISQPEAFPRWWPAAWLRYKELTPGDQLGLGRTFRVRVKGWLPYNLSLQLQIVEVQPGARVTTMVSGDLVGRGIWTFEKVGSQVLVTYDWHVKAERPIVRYLSPVAHPIFASNHNWVMARGGESIRLELARRKAASDEERAVVPAPRGPTFPHFTRVSLRVRERG